MKELNFSIDRMNKKKSFLIKACPSTLAAEHIEKKITRRGEIIQFQTRPVSLTASSPAPTAVETHKNLQADPDSTHKRRPGNKKPPQLKSITSRAFPNSSRAPRLFSNPRRRRIQRRKRRKRRRRVAIHARTNVGDSRGRRRGERETR